MADPNPIRLASLMLLFVTRIDSSSRPFLPRLMMYARSNARSDSMTVMTMITMLIGRMTGKTTRKNVWRCVRAVDRGGLTQGRVDALESRQVQDHHVADVAPAGREEDGPQVERRVAEPVDGVVPPMVPEDAVDEPLRVYNSCPMNPTMASDSTTGM